MRPTAQPRPRTSHQHKLEPLAGRELDAHDIAFVHGCLRTAPAAVMLDDDAFSAALIGYWRAAVRFDPGREASWPSFAGDRIRHAVQDEARRQDHLSRSHRREVTAGTADAPRHLWLDQPIRSDKSARGTGAPSDTQTFADIIAAPAGEDTDMRLTVDAAYEAVHRVNPRIAAVMRLYYEQGWLDTDIAAFFGVSRSRVSQLRELGREMLRELLPLDLLDAA